MPPIAARDYEVVRRSRPAPDAIQLWVVVHRSMTQRELVQLTRDLSTVDGLRLRLMDVYTSTEAYDACQGVAQHDLHSVRSPDPQYLEYGKTCTRGTLLQVMEKKGELRLKWYGPMSGHPDVLLAH